MIIILFLIKLFLITLFIYIIYYLVNYYLVNHDVFLKESFQNNSSLTDPKYPGTAVTRMNNIISNIKSLTPAELSVDWNSVRTNLLKAGGMRNIQSGVGNDSHCFEDFNHCDLTPIRDSMFNQKNNGRVNNIDQTNSLGSSIVAASIPDPGPGGSWCTCMINCNTQPDPKDVAHVQFQSKIAFKLVWAPPNYTTFVLIDDSGNLLNYGTPTGNLPDYKSRKDNFSLTIGSKYSDAAIKIGKNN